jgi:hypothetical protein
MTTQTRDDVRIDDAAEILECDGITLFVIGSRENPEEVWSGLARKHGEMIAVAQERDGELVVSWHYNHKPVAWKIRCAFRAVKMRATWDGDIWSAVHVDLAPRGPAAA